MAIECEIHGIISEDDVVTTESVQREEGYRSITFQAERCCSINSCGGEVRDVEDDAEEDDDE